MTETRPNGSSPDNDLSRYQPPERTDPNVWPELKANGDFEVSPDKLENLAKAMEREIEQLKTKIASFKTGGDSVATAYLGENSAARAVTSTSTLAHQNLVRLTDQIELAYTDIIKRIRASKNKYEWADQTSEQAATNAGQGLPTTGTQPY